MPVSTFVQPNFTAQTAAAYKAALDAAIAVLATVGADYACHAKAAPDMQVLVDAGQLFLANSTLVSNAQQTSITIVAPVGDPRIDRIVINDQTGVVSVITGTPAASPAAPAITAGTRPIAQILLQTSSTVIANSMITDERVVVTFDVAAYIRTLLDDVDATTARATLGSTTVGDAVFIAASTAAARTAIGAAALAGLSTQDFAANALTVAGLITATAGQLKFPATQNPSADANTLDDYEEGTFTPSLTFGGASVGITYALQSGSYQKVGNRIHINGLVQTSNKGSSVGAARIAGLPFVIRNSNDSTASMAIRTSSVTYTGRLCTLALAGTATVDLEQTAETGVTSAISDTSFVNSTITHVSGSYRTD